MKTFKEFMGESAFNSTDPSGFVVTDDSRASKSVYGVFDIEDTTYGVSINLTKFNNSREIYELQLYMVKGNKPILWAFKSQKHIEKAIKMAFVIIIKAWEYNTSMIVTDVLIEPPKKLAGIVKKTFARESKRISSKFMLDTFKTKSGEILFLNTIPDDSVYVGNIELGDAFTIGSKSYLNNNYLEYKTKPPKRIISTTPIK